jgi:hypothetical protein
MENAQNPDFCTRDLAIYKKEFIFVSRDIMAFIHEGEVL